MRQIKGYGYTNMGPVIIPPLPQLVVLTDRDDGSLWAVTFDAITEHLALDNTASLINNLRLLEGVRQYTANNEPYIDEDGQFRLFVRGGRIGLDYNPYPVGILSLADAPQYARDGNFIRQINITAFTPSTVRIGYIV